MVHASVHLDGDGDLADANDLTCVSDEFNSTTISLSYDNNGNPTLDTAGAALRRSSRSDARVLLGPLSQKLTNDGLYDYVCDAWNP